MAARKHHAPKGRVKRNGPGAFGHPGRRGAVPMSTLTASRRAEAGPGATSWWRTLEGVLRYDVRPDTRDFVALCMIMVPPPACRHLESREDARGGGSARPWCFCCLGRSPRGTARPHRSVRRPFWDEPALASFESSTRICGRKAPTRRIFAHTVRAHAPGQRARWAPSTSYVIVHGRVA